MNKIFRIIFSILITLKFVALILSIIVYVKRPNSEILNPLKKQMESKGNYNRYYYEKFTDVFTSFGLLEILLIYPLMIITAILSLVTMCLLVSFFTDCYECRKISGMVLVIICLLNTFIFLLQDYSIKEKIDLPDEEIYIYDKDLNDKIRDGLKKVKKRKKNLIICHYFLISFYSAEIILITIELVIKNIQGNDNQAQNQVQINQGTERPNNGLVLSENINHENKPNN